MTWFVITAVAPLRAEPSHRSEMTSQMLFGELADELEARGDFVRIRSRYDGYEGWCQRRQLTKLEGENYPWPVEFTRHPDDYVLVNDTRVQLSPGSCCFYLPGQQSFKVGPYNLSFQIQNNSHNTINRQGPEDVVNHARHFLGTPYLWGGRSFYGMDCSGLSQTAYKLAGKFLPRDSGPQSQEGEIVNLLQEARAGDLAFFDNEEGKIVHVGIMLNPTEIIHASASVRIDPIDSYGIVHREEGGRTHKLRIIKRIF